MKRFIETMTKHKSLAIWYLIFVPMSGLITAVPTEWLNGGVRAVWWIIIISLVQLQLHWYSQEECERKHPEVQAPPREKLRVLGPSKFMLLQDENGEFWILPGPFTDADSYRERPGFNLRGTIRWTWLTEADAEGVCREARKLISTRPWETRQ